VRDRPARRSSNNQKPSNVRISTAYILTFDGFSDADSEILKPRWLLTPSATAKLNHTVSVISTVYRTFAVQPKAQTPTRPWPSH
jgi:hypothetical protein